MIDFDQMLIHVGEFGLYQKVLFVFQAPFCIFVTFALFGQLFMTYPYPRFYWCRATFEGTTGSDLLTDEQKTNLSIPYENDEPNFCLHYQLTDSNSKRQIIQSFVNSANSICGTQNRQNLCIINFVNLTDDVVRNSNSILTTSRINTRSTFTTTKGPILPDYDYLDHLAIRLKRQGYFPRHRQGYGNFRYPYIPQSPATSTNNIGRGQGGIYNSQTFPSSSTTIRTITISTSTEGRNRNILTMTQTIPNAMGQSQNMNNFFINISMPNNTFINATQISNLNWTTSECKNWDWNRTAMPVKATIITDANWLCDPEYYIVLSSSLFFVGAIIGGIIIGWIADNHGRVPALIAANMCGCIGGALSATVTQFPEAYQFPLFCVFRFITGFSFDNSFTMIYILVLEYVGPKYRTMVANLSIAVFFTVGTVILPWIAVALQDWTIYGLIISLPMLLSLFAICIVPESARWLLSKGKIKRATDILRKFSKINKANVSEEIFEDFENDAQKLYDEISLEEQEVSLLSALFKSKKILKNFILLTFIWGMIALTFDGHSRNVLNLGDDIFVMFTIASLTEFPADIFLILTLDRVGRRWLGFFCAIFAGLFSISSAFIPRGDEFTIALIVMAMISRFFVNVSFNVGLQYAAELLPTIIRAQGVNFIHIMGYTASIVSPYIASIGRTNPALSLILLGSCSLVAGVLTLFLPETLGEDLPNTIEDGEAFGRNQSFWYCPLCTDLEPSTPEERDTMLPAIHEEGDEFNRLTIDSVQLRNNFRSTLRGEGFRSSIISRGSSYGSNSSVKRRFNDIPKVQLDPNPNEKSKLRRVYTK